MSIFEWPFYTGFTVIPNDIAFLSLKILFVLANSVDPDEMLCYAEFHLGFHCLQN